MDDFEEVNESVEVVGREMAPEQDAQDFGPDIKVLSDDEENEITGGGTSRIITRNITTYGNSVMAGLTGPGGIRYCNISPSGVVGCTIGSSTVTFRKYNSSWKGRVVESIVLQYGNNSVKNLYYVTFK